MTTQRFAPAHLGFQAFTIAALVTLAAGALISHGDVQAQEPSPSAGALLTAQKTQPVYAGQLPRVEIHGKRIRG